MNTPLLQLEEKLDQLIAQLDATRQQNDALRARCRQLEAQMDTAREQLEQMVARLPETEVAAQTPLMPPMQEAML